MAFAHLRLPARSLRSLRVRPSAFLAERSFAGLREIGTRVSRVVTVDLGPSTPTNEPAALGLCDSYGNTETVALADLDGDGLTGFADNCPQIANADQLDSGGVATTTPDGIGDACQCGDVDGQRHRERPGRERDQAPRPRPAEPDLRRAGNCDVTGNGLCNGQDANAVKRAALGDPTPSFGQRCHNALGLAVPPICKSVPAPGAPTGVHR